jgi:hypothetical protein
MSSTSHSFHTISAWEIANAYRKMCQPSVSLNESVSQRQLVSEKIRGNTNKLRDKVRKYLASVIEVDPEEAKELGSSDPLVFAYLAFKREYGWDIEKVGLFNAASEWLRNGPDFINIDFLTKDMRNKLTEWYEESPEEAEKFNDERIERSFLYLVVGEILRAGERAEKSSSIKPGKKADESTGADGWERLEGFPTYMLSFAVNGDDSSISEEDRRNYENWKEENGIIDVEPVEDENPESYFSRYPLFGLPADCEDVMVKYGSSSIKPGKKADESTDKPHGFKDFMAGKSVKTPSIEESASSKSISTPIMREKEPKPEVKDATAKEVKSFKKAITLPTASAKGTKKPVEIKYDKDEKGANKSAVKNADKKATSFGKTVSVKDTEKKQAVKLNRFHRPIKTPVSPSGKPVSGAETR